MLKSVLSDTPSEGLRDEAGQMGESTEDETPELSAERGFYQQDINHVCNASSLLPLCIHWKVTGSVIGAPYQMLQEFLFFTTSSALACLSISC